MLLRYRLFRAGNSVRMPLTTAGERVLDAVAAVGGSTANVQDTNVQLTRGNQVKTVALEDLWLIRAKIFYCSVAMLLR